MRLAWALFLVAASHRAFADDVPAVSTNVPADEHLAAGFGDDSFFQAYPSLTLTHPLNAADNISADVIDYLSYHSLEFDFNWNHPSGFWTISPGLGTTVGQGAWGLNNDPRNYIGRDLVPQVDFYYDSPEWEAQALQEIWIPIQGISSGKLWFTETNWWAAVKRQGLGIGPQLETFGTKDGYQPIRLSHCWIGAHMLKEFLNGAAFHLFLGYDTISIASYLGAPKPAGAVFSATFSYPLF